MTTIGFDPDIGKGTRWKKGQRSPNPGGRPKSRLLSEALRVRLAEPKPEYSEGARKAKLEGEVLLSLIVDHEGKARDIRVIAPFGDGLDEKAVDAIKTWKFDPATKDGKPVAVQIMIEVSFRLYGPSGMGKVEVVGDSYGMNFDSYLEPIILKLRSAGVRQRRTRHMLQRSSRGR